MIYLNAEQGFGQPYTKTPKAPDALRALLGLSEGDLLRLTSSGSSALAEVLYAQLFEHIYETGKTHIISTALEEASLQRLLKRFALRGVSHTLLQPNERGQITPEAVEAALTPRTALVSLSWAHALTGVVHPVYDIGRLLQERGVDFHVDVTAILGKLYFRAGDVPVDYLTLDGARLGAEGGAVVVMEGSECGALVPDAPSLCAEGLNRVAHLLSDDFDHVCTETALLRDYFEEHAPGTPLYRETERLPNITAIAFPQIHHEYLLYHLAEQGIFASMGGGQFPRLPHNVLSFALGRATTRAEIDKVLALLQETCRRFAW